MIILQALAFLLVLVLLCDSRPVSERQEKKIQTKQFKLEKARARLKRLKYNQNLRNKSQQKATEEKMLYSNSNRSKWIETQIKQEKLEGNIRRHNLAAKLIRQYVPGVSDALNHRADNLQIGTQKYQQRKDILKKNGKKSDRDFFVNYHQENHTYLDFLDDADDYQQIIDKNTKYLAKHHSKLSGSDLQRSTS